jgi:CheY-like chemotaxis protein
MMRVLIVDDHPIVRRALRELLSDEFHGAAFGEASDARQALEQLRKKQWDVALLDIALPGKSGLDLLKELKAEWPKLPVLVLISLGSWKRSALKIVRRSSSTRSERACWFFVPNGAASVQSATCFPAFSLPVGQTPTNLSARVLQTNQPDADVHDRHRDLFSHLMLRRAQILTKNKLKKELYHEKQ